MKSQHEHLRAKATELRKQGNSVRDIEAKIGIPRSTLSYWLRKVSIAKRHKVKLHKRWMKALVHARKKAVVWHNAQKTNRLHLAKQEALTSLSHIDAKDPHVIELALAILYLGEGAKKSDNTALGNSDPRILRFLVKSLRTTYKVPVTDLRCDLHIRADQNATKEVLYWSRELGIPVENFCKTSIDKRTEGRPTYKHYHGVCIVRCGRVAIQRKLGYIATTFCDQVAGSTVGG